MSNDRQGRKRIVEIILASCLFCTLSGCGKASYDKTTIEFAKNGHIIEHIVEEFPAQLYDKDEWEQATSARVDEYNAKGKSQIKFYDISYENEILKCSLDYEDDDAYYYLNEQPIFYGTIAQAIKAGYSLLIPVHSADSGEALTTERLKNMQDSTIAIFNGQTDVVLFGKPAYVSDNVNLAEGHKKGNITDDNTCYIVFE